MFFMGFIQRGFFGMEGKKATLRSQTISIPRNLHEKRFFERPIDSIFYPNETVMIIRNAIKACEHYSRLTDSV